MRHKISGFLLFFLIFSFLFVGCSTPPSEIPALEIPEELPSIVKQYKQVKIWGSSSSLTGTSVFLNKGEYFSLIGNGKIKKWPGFVGTLNEYRAYAYPGNDTIARIGKNFFYSVGTSSYAGYPIEAIYSGELFLGIVDGEVDAYGNPLNFDNYRDNSGSLTVEIIVWNSQNWIEIIEFFTDLKRHNPDNAIIERAINLISYRQQINFFEAKTSEEVVIVEKEIKELREERDNAGLANKETSSLLASESTDQTTNKINRLEDHLKKLTETLASLEEMKNRWETEKIKSANLEEELEFQKLREKELTTRLEVGSKTPPSIYVATPKDQSRSETATVLLSGMVVDDTGLKQIDISVNGVPLINKLTRDLKLSEGNLSRRYDFKERISISEGVNKVRIRAIDSDDLAIERNITITKLETRAKLWAVVIGINNYKNVHGLKFAVNDAEKFYNHLVEKNKIPLDHIKLLINEEAGLTRLRSTLGTYLKNKAGPDDMVIIYFAGHGACEKDVYSPDGDGLEKYLLPYDADPNDLFATALHMGEISRIFQRIKSERLIFIADSCYSGASGGRTIATGQYRANISDAFLDRITAGKGKIILSASGANEVSEEKDQLKQGVFTYYLIEGLKGNADTDNDGLVTVDEVYRYVSKRVPEATNQAQHPVKKGTVEGQFVLSITD